MHMPPRRMIRASELGEYAYCARAWWLRRVQGAPSANVRELRAGTQAHAAHGRLLWLARALRVFALACAALAVLVLLLA